MTADEQDRSTWVSGRTVIMAVLDHVFARVTRGCLLVGANPAHVFDMSLIFPGCLNYSQRKHFIVSA